MTRPDAPRGLARGVGPRRGHGDQFERPTRGGRAETARSAGTTERTERVPADAGPQYETGTTIVALAAADGVVMAADRRMSLGGRFTANKNVRKIEQVHPTAAAAISGAVGPAQGFLDSLRAETGLYEARRGDPMSVTALAQTAGHLVRGLRVTPLLAGVDESGTAVYELDGSGSVLEDDYAASGSGMQVAYGVLEGRFDPGASVETATEAATAAVAAASERDTASGNGVTVATITDEGVEFHDDSADGDDSLGGGGGANDGSEGGDGSGDSGGSAAGNDGGNDGNGDGGGANGDGGGAGGDGTGEGVV